MVSIVSKELHFDEELKKKIEFICDFCNTKPTIINGCIKNIKRTNLPSFTVVVFYEPNFA